MGTILVEGLGEIQIKGNVPTFEEQEAIIKKLKEPNGGEQIEEEIEVETQAKIPPIPEPIETIEYQKTEDLASGLKKGFTERETAKAALSLGGFATGAAAGVPFGPIGSAVGAIGGSILGGAAGGQIHDILSSYIQGNTLTLDDTSKQAWRDIKSEALWGTIAQSFPALKPMITRLILKKQQGKLVADDIKKASEASKRIGVDLFPMDVSGKFGQMYSKVIGIFPWVGRPMKIAGSQRAQSLNKIKNQYLDDLAPNASMSELGVDMFEAAKKSSKAFRNMSSGLYTDFYESAAKIKKPFIPTTTIKAEAQNIIKDYLSKRPKYVTTTTLRGRKIKKKIAIPAAVNAKYANFIKYLSRIDDYVSPQQLKQLKQDIGEYSKLVAGKDGAGVFRLSNLAEATEVALRNFKNYNYNVVDAKTATELMKKIKIADNFYANNIIKFKGPTAKRFAKTEKNIFEPGFKKRGVIDPDETFQAVVKTSSPQSLEDLRFLIGDENYAKVTKKVIDNAFGKSIAKADDFRGLVFDPYKLEESLGLAGRNQSEKLFNLVKGTEINPHKLLDLIEVSKLHANLQVPDVGTFMMRRLTLGGYKSVIGGIFMGAGVMQNPIVTSSVILLSRGGSNFLANPKNIDLVLDALNTTAPRALRYKAAIDLLSRKVRDTTNPEEKKFFQAMEEEFEDNKDFILDTLGD